MAVALSSLRVTSDFDASGYARGAAQKVAADAQMIAADKARNAALAQADAALAKIPGGMAAVSRSLLDGYGAGAQFEAIVRRIGNATDRGMGLDRANLLLDAAYKKFGLTADAARLTEQGFVSIVPAVNQLNEALANYEQQVARAELVTRAFAEAKALLSTQAANQKDINETLGVNLAGNVGDARASADAFLAQYGGLAGVAKAEAEQIGKNFSDELNSRLVRGVESSANKSAEAFRGMFDELDAISKSRSEQLAAIAETKAEHFAAVTQQGIRDAFRMDARATDFQLPGADGRTNTATVSALTEFAAAEDAAAKRAASLRAQINPLETEMVKLGKAIAYDKQLLDAGVISQHEFEQAQAMASKRLSDVDMSMRQAATGGRVLSGELGNLGYQVNDVITGLMLGQPVFMIIAQQGGQIYQIFSRSRASVSEMAISFAASVAGMVTPGRAAFTAIAGSVAIAVGALTNYQSKINEVQRQLSGMGRASGATALGIDAIAQQNSSPTGFSTNEARNLAASLAATGKVGVEAIGPIVALGHDFAKTFGVDAKEATDILTKAFADPVKGADDLNQRLGFLDANTKILIESLVTQGNRTEAVRILTDRIKGSIADATQITSVWSRAWTATGNAASDFFDRVGRGADRLFSGGSGLDEKINNLTLDLLSLQKAKIEGGFWNWLTTDINPDQRIAAITSEIERLRKTKLIQSTPADPETANKQRALEIDAIARATLPTIDATRKLHDETVALQQAFDRPELQKYITLIGTDLVLALNRKKAAEDAMRGADPIKNQIADMESQVRLLDQRTIADRAREAAAAEKRRQALDPNAGTEEERLRKQGLAALAAAGGQTALDNVAKMRIGVFGLVPVAAVASKSQEETDDRNQRRLPKAA